MAFSARTQCQGRMGCRPDLTGARSSPARRWQAAACSVWERSSGSSPGTRWDTDTGAVPSRTDRCGGLLTSAAWRFSRSRWASRYVTFSHTGSVMSDGNPTPLALDGMGSFAGGRFHGRGKQHLVRLVRNSEDRNPAGHGRRPVGRPFGGLRPDRLRRYHHTGLRRAPAEAGEGLRQPQRHDGELCRRHCLPPPLLAHRRGDGRRTGRR